MKQSKMQKEENVITTNCKLDQTQVDKSLSQAHYLEDDGSPKQIKKTVDNKDLD
jgi:hypothetical protein